MRKVALITLHGMGKIKPSYFAELEVGLKDRLGDAWSAVSFQNVQYAPILQAPEDALWDAMMACPDNALDGVKLRQFLLYGFGDAGSLEHSLKSDKRAYLATQAEIFAALSRALADGGPAVPVVIIAQSLGCQVISNYAWDAQHERNLFDPAFATYRQHQPVTDLPPPRPASSSSPPAATFRSSSPRYAERVCFAAPNAEFRWDNYYIAITSISVTYC